MFYLISNVFLSLPLSRLFHHQKCHNLLWSGFEFKSKLSWQCKTYFSASLQARFDFIWEGKQEITILALCNLRGASQNWVWDFFEELDSREFSYIKLPISENFNLNFRRGRWITNARYGIMLNPERWLTCIRVIYREFFRCGGEGRTHFTFRYFNPATCEGNDLIMIRRSDVIKNQYFKWQFFFLSMWWGEKCGGKIKGEGRRWLIDHSHYLIMIPFH